MPRKRSTGFPDRPLKTGQVARILGLSHRHLLRCLLNGTYPDPPRDVNTQSRLWTMKHVETIRRLREEVTAR